MAKKIVRYGKTPNAKYDDSIYTHYVKKCEWCGREFECRRKDAKYCHSLCQHRASVARRTQSSEQAQEKMEKQSPRARGELSPIRQRDKSLFEQIFSQDLPKKEKEILQSLTERQKTELWHKVCSMRDNGMDPFKTMYVEDGRFDLAAYLLNGNFQPSKMKIIWFNF